jgi:hypothetical protein
VAPAGHDLARISISAAPENAPIQRVNSGSPSINDVDEEKDEEKVVDPGVDNAGNVAIAVPQAQNDPPQRGGRFGGITWRNVRDFVIANTPGPITGISGALGTGASAASSLLDTGTSALRGVSKLGAGANLVTAAANLVGIGGEIYDTYKNGGVKRFWGGLKANNPFKNAQDANASDAQSRSAAKGSVLTTTTNAIDLANQVPSALNSITSASGETGPQALGTIASSASMAANTIVALRSGYRAWKSQKHARNVDKLLAENGELKSEGVKGAAKYFSRQMKKRRWRNAAGALGAAASVVGSGLTIGGLTVAGPLAAAGGGLIATGLGAHKLWRWNKKRKAGQLGVEREKHARAIHTAINNPEHRDHDDAVKLLKARGISPQQAMGDEGVEFLKRTALSW